MADIELSLGYADNARTRAIMTGAVKPEGIELICTRSGMSELAWRQLGYKEFDVSELSMSSLIIALSHGDDSWVAIPVFSNRRFYHIGVLVRDASGITDPSQLAGKRVGVPEYQQTAALWARGALQHEFGVDPKSIHWHMERLPEKSHGGATGFDPAAIGIDLQYIPLSTNIGEMLNDGELDAALLYIAEPNFVDRSTRKFGPGSGVSPLFPDRRAEATRYFSKTRILPINHGTVIRREIVERHPWVALNLYNAFLESKQRARAESLQELKALVDFDVLDPGVVEALSADPFPYGVAANRNVLESITEYSLEQGLSSRKITLGEIFYPATLEL